MKKLFFILATASLLAAGCASKTISANENKADILLQAGVEALEQKDFTMALRQLTEAAKFNPDSAEIWSNIGVAYVGKNELVRAEDAWKKALQLKSDHHDARLNLGILLIRNKRFPEAERYLREAAKDLTYPKLHLVTYRLGLLYIELKKPQLAEQQLRVAVRENSAYCPAWYRLGMILGERGDYAGAVQSMSGAVKGTCYKNPRAHFEIASLYLKAHDIPQAKSKLLEIIQLFPTSEWANRSEATLNMIR